MLLGRYIQAGWTAGRSSPLRAGQTDCDTHRELIADQFTVNMNSGSTAGVIDRPGGSSTNACLRSCFSITMGQLYEKEKDEDGFLYVAYSGENTFGF